MRCTMVAMTSPPPIIVATRYLQLAAQMTLLVSACALANWLIFIRCTALHYLDAKVDATACMSWPITLRRFWCCSAFL